MIGNIILDSKTGEPVDSSGKKLTPSSYNPPYEVKRLFARVQKDFQTGYSLVTKPLDEFDGLSVLQRARKDQETFAAYVGIEFMPKHLQWRWKGRKNTARNKLIGILAHLLAGMLYPFVYAQNENDEEDKMTASAMRILVEERLRKANYEVKFFYSVLCALVNPAVWVEVEFVEVLQTIRQKMADGTMKVSQAVDEILSGVLLHIVPVDEMLPGDLYSGTGDVQSLPFIVRMRRIHYDHARGKYAGKHFDENGKDYFDHVHAGKTKYLVMIADKETLFDIDDTDSDSNFVQEITIMYKKDDLKFTWVGGVGMFDHSKPYENPFTHRRMVMTKDGWATVPVYPYAMGGFEPIDPAGRFLFFKSGAFKEYWEDRKINEIDRLLVDGLKLDIFKPTFISGIAKVDESVMAPGATVAMPQGASVNSYSLGSNLVAAFNAITEASKDMSESTQDKVMQGITEKGITATQTNEAKMNARIFLGVFGFMIANLVKQVGELVMDCVIMYDTVGDLQGYTNGALAMKYKNIIARGKDKGKNVTHKIIFTDRMMGKTKMSKESLRKKEWDLLRKAGGEDSDQRIWEINPYKFARTKFSMFIDADKIVSRSMGADKLEKQEAFERLMDPRVLPFVDPEAVVTDFVIEEYSKGDPDRYKKKQSQDELVQSLLGQIQGGEKQQVEK